ncbi:MAG: hypothetical protein ABEH38_08420 [Flavobacteriales bacterium]
MIRRAYQIFAFSLTVVIFSKCGPPVEIVSGDKTLSYLDDKKKIAMKFDYSNTTVGGDEQSEKAFIKQKVKEKNEEEPGSGEEWKKKWENNQKNVYQPAFRSQFSEYLIECDYDLADKPKDADYTAIVHIEMIEPGFYGGVVHKPAEIHTRMEVVKNGKEDSPKTTMKDEHGTSTGEHMTTKDRLRNAYKNTAMKYGRHFRDQLCSD